MDDDGGSVWGAVDAAHLYQIRYIPVRFFKADPFSDADRDHVSRIFVVGLDGARVSSKKASYAVGDRGVFCRDGPVGDILGRYLALMVGESGAYERIVYAAALLRVVVDDDWLTANLERLGTVFTLSGVRWWGGRSHGDLAEVGESGSIFVSCGRSCRRRLGQSYLYGDVPNVYVVCAGAPRL